MNSGWTEELHYSVIILCPRSPWRNPLIYTGGFPLQAGLANWAHGTPMAEILPITNIDYSGKRPWMGGFIEYPAQKQYIVSGSLLKEISKSNRNACEEACLALGARCVSFVHTTTAPNKCQLFNGLPLYDTVAQKDGNAVVHSRYVKLCDATLGAGCCQAQLKSTPTAPVQQSQCKAEGIAMGSTNPWVCSPQCTPAGRTRKLTCPAAFGQGNVVDKDIAGAATGKDLCAELCCGTEVMSAADDVVASTSGGIRRFCTFDGASVQNVCTDPGQVALWSGAATYKQGVIAYTCGGVACADWEAAFAFTNGLAWSARSANLAIPKSCYVASRDVPFGVNPPPNVGSATYWSAIECAHVQYLTRSYPLDCANTQLAEYKKTDHPELTLTGKMHTVKRERNREREIERKSGEGINPVVYGLIGTVSSEFSSSGSDSLSAPTK